MGKAAQGFSVPAKRDRKAYTKYAAAGNPGRTKSIGKKTIYGWALKREKNADH
jgi:hypothetical protein